MFNEMNVMIFAVYLVDTIAAYVLGYYLVDTVLELVTGRSRELYYETQKMTERQIRKDIKVLAMLQFTLTFGLLAAISAIGLNDSWFYVIPLVASLYFMHSNFNDMKKLRRAK